MPEFLSSQNIPIQSHDDTTAGGIPVTVTFDTRPNNPWLSSRSALSASNHSGFSQNSAPRAGSGNVHVPPSTTQSQSFSATAGTSGSRDDNFQWTDTQYISPSLSPTIKLL